MEVMDYNCFLSGFCLTAVAQASIKGSKFKVYECDVSQSCSILNFSPSDARDWFILIILR